MVLHYVPFIVYMFSDVRLQPRHRWVDNIKMDLREIEREDGMDWIDRAPDRYQWRALVNTVMKLWVP
jgi:hypothetical protein